MNTFVKVMHINTCNCAACASVPTLGIEMPYEVVKENCLAVACPEAAVMLSDKDKRLALEATTGSHRKATFVCPDCGQEFTFTEEKARRKLISQVVAENQLFFSVACTMNDVACSKAMTWFREKIYFSRDYSDIPRQLLEYSNDSNMLKAISDYAKAADVGIEDMKFEINSKEINEEADLPANIPEEVKAALVQFMHVLSETSNNSETHLKMGQVNATSMHQGQNKDGTSHMFSMELADESDGTRKLMAIAPAIESVLLKGGLLLVDEIEKELHPALVELIVAKFQSKKTNPNGAQIVFTTHNTDLLSMELLRKDQLYFVDKNKDDGASELYSISDFSTRTTENVRKGYLLGKYGATPNVEIEEVE